MPEHETKFRNVGENICLRDEIGILKWETFFCRMFHENLANIKLGNFQTWAHFLGIP